MIIEIKQQFSEEILEAATQRYGVERGDLKDLGGFESFVYELSYLDNPSIMKITHSLRRTKHYLMGEVEFLNFLADNNALVARALPSQNGEFVEIIPTAEEGSYFLVVVFEKAKGRLPDAEDWNADLFEKWGNVLGRIHKIAKEFQLSDLAYKRQEWNEEDQLDIDKYLPHSQTEVFRKVKKLLARIDSLPKDRDSYGLIHGDLHHKNFFLDNGLITAFDFDDVTYNWYISDIALILYFANLFPLKPWNKEEFPRNFLEPFLKGYRQENQLESVWLGHLPDFLRLNHVFQYVILYQSLDINNLTDAQKKSLERHRKEIETEATIIDFDFMSL